MVSDLQLLRTKSDPTVADTAWYSTQAVPTPAGILAEMPRAPKWTGVLLAFRMNDSGGDRVADNSTRADVTVIYVDQVHGVVSKGKTYAQHEIINALDAEVPAGVQFTVHLSAVTNAPATLDNIGVYWAPQSVDGAGAVGYSATGVVLVDPIAGPCNVVPGVEADYKFGRNPSVGTSYEAIWGIGDAYNWLTAASTLVVLSNDANDDVSGTGAQQVTIEGLDSTGIVIAETVDLAGGTTSTATTLSFFRVNRAYVYRVGSYGATAAGDLDVQTSGAGTKLGRIVQGFDQTEQAIRTVPSNYVGHVVALTMATSGNGVNLRISTREDAGNTGADYRPFRNRGSWLARTEVTREWRTSIRCPGFTDIIVEAQRSGGSNANCAVQFDMYMRRDTT